MSNVAVNRAENPALSHPFMLVIPDSLKKSLAYRLGGMRPAEIVGVGA
jgi:hypothetical protein